MPADSSNNLVANILLRQLFYPVIFFFVTLIIYLGVSLFNKKTALTATVFVAIGIVFNILLSQNFDINELLWAVLALSLGVLVAFLAHKSVKRQN